MKQAPWKINAQSFLIMYSILAAIAGVFVVFALTVDSKEACTSPFLAVLPLSLSILLFIISGEGITDAMDEDDVRKYVSFFIPYNIAVILLFFGIYETIHLKYEIVWWLNGILLIAMIFLTKRWWGKRGLRWLLTAPQSEYEDYLMELDGTTENPDPDKGWCFRLYMRIRKCLAKTEKQEFEELTIQLGVSKIHGVGVFASRKINIGDKVAEGIHPEDYNHLIKWQDVDSQSESIKNKIRDFCVGTPEGFIPPDDYDFNSLSVEWFFNHSCGGNVGFDEHGDFVAIRQVVEGDELTYDYGLAESNPNFKMECRCGSSTCRKVITGDDWKAESFRQVHLNHMLPRLRK